MSKKFNLAGRSGNAKIAISLLDLLGHTGTFTGAQGAVTGGSMLAWAIEREGKIVDWVARDLETVLARFQPD